MLAILNVLKILVSECSSSSSQHEKKISHTTVNVSSTYTIHTLALHRSHFIFHITVVTRVVDVSRRVSDFVFADAVVVLHVVGQAVHMTRLLASDATEVGCPRTSVAWLPLADEAYLPLVKDALDPVVEYCPPRHVTGRRRSGDGRCQLVSCATSSTKCWKFGHIFLAVASPRENLATM